jgi:hypothetical protein
MKPIARGCVAMPKAWLISSSRKHKFILAEERTFLRKVVT